MPRLEIDGILNLPGYEVESVAGRNPVVLHARYLGPNRCPSCGSSNLRNKDRYRRRVRHESVGTRPCFLVLEGHKYQCLDCGRYFHQRFPGILPYRRSTEGFRREVFNQHRDGICQQTLSREKGIGSATVERWFHDLLARKVAERKNNPCPRVLGIDEHYFSRKHGYATTLCDLQHHRVHDVVLGRSEAALGVYFQGLREPQRVKVVCMDLSNTYRALVKTYLPRARIVADRFHVIRLINQHFLAAWRQIDPEGSKHRGLIILMRRHQHNLQPLQKARLQNYLTGHPVLGVMYHFKQGLCSLMLEKERTARHCRRLIPRLLSDIQNLKSSALPAMQTLGETLDRWKEEIACMWRFTKNNGITEGFHTKMEMISRRAFGFKNFNNYRLRVTALCA